MALLSPHTTCSQPASPLTATLKHRESDHFLALLHHHPGSHHVSSPHLDSTPDPAPATCSRPCSRVICSHHSNGHGPVKNVSPSGLSSAHESRMAPITKQPQSSPRLPGSALLMVNLYPLPRILLFFQPRPCSCLCYFYTPPSTSSRSHRAHRLTSFCTTLHLLQTGLP